MLNGFCYVMLVLCVFRKTHEQINIISILRKLDLPQMVKKCNTIDITVADKSTVSTYLDYFQLHVHAAYVLPDTKVPCR